MSLVIIVCCQEEVYPRGLLLFQRSPIECCVSECDLETSSVGRFMPTSAVEPWKKKWASKSEMSK